MCDTATQWLDLKFVVTDKVAGSNAIDAASKHGQIFLPHIAGVFRMRQYKLLVPSICPRRIKSPHTGKCVTCREPVVARRSTIENS